MADEHKEVDPCIAVVRSLELLLEVRRREISLVCAQLSQEEQRAYKSRLDCVGEQIDAFRTGRICRRDMNRIAGILFAML